MIQWAALITAVATVVLMVTGLVTFWLALRRFRREILSISVSAEYGGVGGEGYEEVGFQVYLTNEGTQDAVVYSAGYHVKGERNFEFPAEYIYWRPAEEGDEGVTPASESPSGYCDRYRPDSPFQTIHSEMMFPIRIPAGGIYTGLWPVRMVGHRELLAGLQERVLSDYPGLNASTDNPIPYIFFTTIHRTTKVKLRPFGRCPRLVLLYRRAIYKLRRILTRSLVERLLFSTQSGFGYWADRQVRSDRRRHRFFFPPRSFDRGILPMSVEEKERRKLQPYQWGPSNFRQVQKQAEEITKNGGHIETENHTFKVVTSGGFRYGLLSATVERPAGHSTYSAHAFLELNMLLGLDEFWAHPVMDTVCEPAAGGRCEVYDTRHYVIPHRMD